MLIYTEGSVVEARRNKLEKATISSKTRIGVRVAIGNRIGAAGGEASSVDSARRIVEAAVASAKAAPGDPRWPGFNPVVGKSRDVEVFDARTSRTTVEELVEILDSQVSLAREKGAEVAQAAIGASKVYTVYGNTEAGKLVEEEATSATYYVELKAVRNGREGTYIEWIDRVRLLDEEVEEATRKAAVRVFDAAEAVVVESFRGTLLLEPREAAAIVATVLSPAISAEDVQEGRSPLKGRIGDQVLSEHLTIADDPFIPYEPESSGFDDEGHPTSKKSVFEDGVLRTFLYDHYTASQEGRESTGNASRRVPHSKPTPAPTNLVLESKTQYATLEEALRDVEKGVLVASTIGSWMSNPVSGQINATITLGYLIENGVIVRPVKGLTIGDNIYEALGKRFLGSVGDRVCIGGVCTATLLVSDSTFAGK